MTHFSPAAGDTSSSAASMIERLGLQPHPEGGWYREVHRSVTKLETQSGQRAALTSIYFLLEHSQHSRWHVVAADEVWHHSAGAPLELLVYRPASRELRRQRLGPPRDGQEPIGVVQAGEWQAARSLGEYSLVGCDVAPGFDFADFRFIAALPGHEAHFVAELAPHAYML